MSLHSLSAAVHDGSVPLTDAGMMRYFAEQTLERLRGGFYVKDSAHMAFSYAARVLAVGRAAIVTGLGGKVIGQIVPTTVFCPTCDGYLLPNHYCPGVAHDVEPLL